MRAQTVHSRTTDTSDVQRRRSSRRLAAGRRFKGGHAASVGGSAPRAHASTATVATVGLLGLVVGLLGPTASASARSTTCNGAKVVNVSCHEARPVISAIVMRNGWPGRWRVRGFTCVTGRAGYGAELDRTVCRRGVASITAITSGMG
jgi:hypothetical protein